MGSWATRLYSGDFAADLGSSIRAVCQHTRIDYSVMTGLDQTRETIAALNERRA